MTRWHFYPWRISISHVIKFTKSLKMENFIIKLAPILRVFFFKCWNFHWIFFSYIFIIFLTFTSQKFLIFAQALFKLFALAFVLCMRKIIMYERIFRRCYFTRMSNPIDLIYKLLKSPVIIFYLTQFNIHLHNLMHVQFISIHFIQFAEFNPIN